MEQASSCRKHPLSPSESEPEESITTVKKRPDEGYFNAQNTISTPQQSISDTVSKPEYLFSVPLTDEELISSAFEHGTKAVTLAIKGTEKFNNNSIFKMKKEIVFIAGGKEHIKEIKMAREGYFIVKVLNPSAAIAITKIKSLFFKPVYVSLFKNNLLRKFIIRGVDLNLPLEEIYNELSQEDIPIKEIKRLNFKQNNDTYPSRSVIFTTIGSLFYNEVIIWYEKFSAELFTNRPRICTRCFRFGHPEKYCKFLAICKHCSKSHDSPCTVEKKDYLCINCEGNHEADSANCPVLKAEKKIYEIMDYYQLSYIEAKQLYTNNNKKNRTYANTISENKPTDTDIKITNLEKRIEAMEKKIDHDLELFTEHITKAIDNKIANTIQNCLNETLTGSIKIEIQKSIKEALGNFELPRIDQSFQDSLPKQHTANCDSENSDINIDSVSSTTSSPEKHSKIFDRVEKHRTKNKNQKTTKKH